MNILQQVSPEHHEAALDMWKTVETVEQVVVAYNETGVPNEEFLEYFRTRNPDNFFVNDYSPMWSKDLCDKKISELCLDQDVGEPSIVRTCLCSLRLG